MRRRVSILALCLGWLCANGAIWNVVQVVAWARMLRDYSQVMPAARALQVTFDGSAPCAMCKFTASAQKSAQDQLPRDAALGGSDRLLLAYPTAAPIVLTAPDDNWPDAGPDTGLIRTATVPVPPPRA